MSTKKPSILFMGTPEFAEVALSELILSNYTIAAVVTMPDRPKGRSGKLVASPVSTLAKTHSILTLKPATKTELELALRTVDFDLIIVAAYGMIIPDAVLEMPRLGAINIHGSLLPKYRGASPIAAAILNGDTTTGITIMEMVSKMDAGDIIAQAEIPIGQDDTTESLSQKMAVLGAKTLIETLSAIISAKYTKTPQSEDEVTYCSLINKADGIINWEEEATFIERKIRAYFPWPGSQAQIDGKTVKIIRAIITDRDYLLKPGELQIDSGKLLVGCTGGTIQINVIQPGGKKPMTTKDFLNGNPKLG